MRKSCTPDQAWVVQGLQDLLQNQEVGYHPSFARVLHASQDSKAFVLLGPPFRVELNQEGFQLEGHYYRQQRAVLRHQLPSMTSYLAFHPCPCRPSGSAEQHLLRRLRMEEDLNLVERQQATDLAYHWYRRAGLNFASSSVAATSSWERSTFPSGC